MTQTSEQGAPRWAFLLWGAVGVGDVLATSAWPATTAQVIAATPLRSAACSRRLERVIGQAWRQAAAG